MTGEPDFVKANKKITKAKEWRGTVNVSMGEDTLTFAHRLLGENEFLDVQQKLDLSELDADPEEPNENVGQTEAQERLLELQQKEELTDEEKEELRGLTDEVAGETEEIEKALGDEGYSLLTKLGRDTIEPTQEDIDYFYDNPTELHQYTEIEKLPDVLTKGRIEEILRNELQKMVTNQPYPVKLNVGMQSFSETMSVLGNGLPE